MTVTEFEVLGLSEPLLRAIRSENYKHPTPIQAQAIPHLLEGRDLLGIAQTGTGKTAAFGLPILQELSENWEKPSPGRPLCIILAPTRELAVQLANEAGVIVVATSSLFMCTRECVSVCKRGHALQ